MTIFKIKFQGGLFYNFFCLKESFSDLQKSLFILSFFGKELKFRTERNRS